MNQDLYNQVYRIAVILPSARIYQLLDNVHSSEAVHAYVDVLVERATQAAGLEFIE